MPISRDTLLRLIRGTALPRHETPRVLSLDAFAWKKGERYGTLLVDLQARCPVDRLPDREATTVARWRSQHRGVRLMSRDRASGYAEGAKRGARRARQSANRSHLLVNRREALQAILACHEHSLPVQEKRGPASSPSAPLIEVVPRASAGQDEQPANAPDLPEPEARPLTAAEQRCQISRRPRKRDPYPPSLRQRWEHGCRHGLQLAREITAQGFGGSASLVCHLLGEWRTSLPAPQPKGRGKARQAAPPPARRISARQAVRPQEDLTMAQQKLLSHLCQAHASLPQVYQLAQAFVSMLKQRQARKLNAWLKRAEQSSSIELRGCAAGIKRDDAAVKAALSLPWGQGQIAGQITG
jgi:transposase